MLKACWDCVAGEPQHRTDDPYNIRLNGGSNNSQWQSNSQNGKMFTVPTQLQDGDQIIIKGNMSDGMLDIGLRPDGNSYNIVCQFNVVYPESEQPHDQIQIRSVQNGQPISTNNSFTASDYFNGTSFDVRFQVLSGGISIKVADSYIDSIPLHHSIEDIRFISVIGEVKELIFLFK